MLQKKLHLTGAKIQTLNERMQHTAVIQINVQNSSLYTC